MPNVGVITMRSTHFYLVDCRGGRLLYEAGWVGQMPALLAHLRAYGVAPAEIKYVMFSHNHMDHADLVQEVKQASGARLVIHEVQIPHLPWLEEFHKRKGEPYLPIQVGPADLVLSGPHPRLPAAVGLDGWLVPTPGHSPDHTTLVLADGKAFTGDLPTPDFAIGEALPTVRASWRALLALGATTFYPAHGAPFGVERVDVGAA
jgi:glyoxylase-like metal-dependent hydrolase (beta-lactamase superfamily II)